jgi:type II secretory pathway pseudopilin PulG
LVELAVVLIVIAVVAGVLIPTFSSAIASNEESAAEAETAAVMRDALAIARFNNRTVPSAQDVATAYSEIGAYAPGVGALEAGRFDVCDADAGDYFDCTGRARGTVVHYRSTGTQVVLVVAGNPRVLVRVSAGGVEA